MTGVIAMLLLFLVVNEHLHDGRYLDLHTTYDVVWRTMISGLYVHGAVKSIWQVLFEQVNLNYQILFSAQIRPRRNKLFVHTKIISWRFNVYVSIDGKRGQTTVDFIVWQYGRFHRMAIRTILSYDPTVCFTHSEGNIIPTIVLLWLHGRYAWILYTERKTAT